MITIDKDLVLLIIVVGWVINGLAGIGLGLIHAERKSYGTFDVGWGLASLLFVFLVLLF